MKGLENATDEQKKSLKKLRRQVVVSVIFRGFKYAGLYLLANIVIVFLDAGWVHNETFAMLATLGSFGLIFHNIVKENARYHDSIEAEIKKILES